MYRPSYWEGTGWTYSTFAAGLLDFPAKHGLLLG